MLRFQLVLTILIVLPNLLQAQMFDASALGPGGFSTVGRAVAYSLNDGFGNSMVILQSAYDENMRNQLGISHEQFVEIQTTTHALQQEAMSKVPQYFGRLQNLKPEDQEALQKEIQGELQAVRNRVEKKLTPEQMQKVRTTVFQAVGGLDSPLINLDALSALDLTEDQRKKADETFKSLEAERKAQLEDMLALTEDAIKSQREGKPPGAEFEQRRAEALKARALATGKKLSEQLRKHLTPEQLAKAEKLLAERPDFLPPLPRELRRESENKEYVPGADSWRPGQGAGDAYAEEKQRRRPFPQTERPTEVQSEPQGETENAVSGSDKETP